MPHEPVSGAPSQPAASLSLWDNLRYNFLHVLPYYTRGTVTRNKFWVGFWARVHPDPLGVRFFRALREKYQSDYLYLYQIVTKTLVILDTAGIQHVLEASPEIYAESKLKRKTVAHFQPGALTISRGDAWRERRRFNEAVLQGGDGLHPYASHFLDAIRSEITVSVPASQARLVWEDFAIVFRRIALRIIFGEANPDVPLVDALEKMMREANRVFALRPSKWFKGYHADVNAYVDHPVANTLAALCSHVPSTEQTKISSQITHWLFAMKDTLAENVVYALALIVSHPEVEQRVRAELAQQPITEPEQIQSLCYLEACIHEAMRLWPSVSQIVRETVVEDRFGAVVVPAGTQVLILNNVNHRSEAIVPSANRYDPERWLHGKPDYAMNHFSNGPQNCAGQHLALFIAKSVLALLLRGGHYKVVKPILLPNAALPDTFNHFEVVFSRTEMSSDDAQ